MTGDDLRALYASGKTQFESAQLSGAELSFAVLRGARLQRANLIKAELRAATLVDANLVDANLTDANLADANLAGANLTGADLTRANLTGANLSRTDLSEAKLCNARLRRTDFTRSYLGGAYLSGANLTDAHLAGADLFSTDFSGACLVGANLAFADLTDTDLTGADMTSANLSHAYLEGTRLEDAQLTRCSLEQTRLCNVSLGPLCRCRELIVSGYCPVDVRSIMRSVSEPLLKDFLRIAGMPEVFIEYMVDCARSLDPEALYSMMRSTFISYGTPDEPFVRKLNDALKREGVHTFFFPDDAVPGEPLHAVMRRGVNEHDRIILVCSRNSLSRKGLLNELEETLRRESRDGGASYLIPLTVDDHVYSDWRPANELVKQAVLDRVVADFRGWPDDETAFVRGMTNLVRALRKPSRVPAP